MKPMKSFFCQLLLLMFCSGIFAQDCRCEKDYRALQAATSRYVEFINHMGGEESFDSNFSLICASDIKKIVNGKLQLKSREELVDQLLSLKQMLGHWVINPVDIVISTEDRAVAVRLVISIEKIGTQTALVILRYTPELQVQEINEVFTQFEGREYEIPKIR
jgi:hypothetical protein